MSDNLTARNYYGEGTYAVTSPTGHVISGPPSGRYWAVSKAKFEEFDRDKRIWWGNDGNNMPRLKRFLSEVSDGRVPQTLWKYEEVGHTQEAKKELLKRVEFASSDSVFDTPKPPRLVKQMLRIGTRAKNSDLVLDFFAGSGSTGDAIMQLNAEDAGDRRFILVQLPEQTGATDYSTISDITKARPKAASKSIGDDNAEKLPGISANAESLDLGFRTFKLSSSNIKPWEADFDTMDQDLLAAVDNIKTDRSEDDVLYELLLKYGLDLAIPTETRTIEGRKVTVTGRARWSFVWPTTLRWTSSPGSQRSRRS